MALHMLEIEEELDGMQRAMPLIPHQKLARLAPAARRTG